MPECDYCGDAFDDEEAYLRHLGAEHEGELGRIDRRRVEALGSGGGGAGLSGRTLLLGAGALVVVAAVAFVVLSSGGGSEKPIEAQSLPNKGADKYISQVETFPSQGRDHVQAGTQVDYARIPPLSGPHYDSPAAAGFYEQTPPLGNLVHSLEHGAVVIYYDPAALTPEVRSSLQAWAQNHQDPWASIIVAPNPNENPQAPYVLTAWRHRLTLQEYDAKAVRAFAAEYLGRGPERRVR